MAFYAFSGNGAPKFSKKKELAVFKCEVLVPSDREKGRLASTWLERGRKCVLNRSHAKMICGGEG
jgi:hypothetical protein